MFKDQELRDKVEALHKHVINGLSKIEEKQNHYEEQLAKINVSLEGLQQTNTNKFEDMNEELQQITQIKEEFGKTLRRFQHEQTKSTDELFNAVKGKVDEHLTGLKKNTQSFKSLEPEVKELMSNFIGLREEINKLTNITKKIKSTDFQLTNYAKNLKDSEEEKIKLLQDISNLKRLIAKERRQKR